MVVKISEVFNNSKRWACLLGLLLFCSTGVAEDAVSFNRDVRPVLSNNCFKCHGPDEGARKAGLRLDLEDASRAALKSGNAPVVPGDAGASALIARITTSDSDDLMPPADSGKSLKPEEIAMLTRWIEQGAEYEKHWSFAKPARPTIPEVRDPSWPRNDLDRFVLARLDCENLTPTREASRSTLLRRLYLDLIGLPPTRDEVTTFLNDRTPEAYENLVDILLASPHFGERWARMWLDIARYADTKGYEADRERTIWPYRDWVIDAFNRDLPFDQFTVEQIAGDLLPEPTQDQRIATAFHRNTMTNDEGGTDDEEFRNAAVIDRVNTTMEAWMGLTMACAQCHTHKYDPISQKEYFEFFAFFNQTADSDKMEDTPVLKTPTPAQDAETDELEKALADAQTALVTAGEDTAQARRDWETYLLRAADTPVTFGPWYKMPPVSGVSRDEFLKTWHDFERHPALEKVYENGNQFMPVPELKDGENLLLGESEAAFTFYRTATCDAERSLILHLGSKDALRVRVNGRVVHKQTAERPLRADDDTIRVPLKAGVNNLVFTVINGPGPGGFYFRSDSATLPPELLAALRLSEEKRDGSSWNTIIRAFADDTGELRQERRALERVESRMAKLEKEIVAVPVMEDLPPTVQRVTHIQLRGSYLDPGDVVAPNVPAAFNGFSADWPRNRMGLAKWLVSPDNPLTARVFVNRIWGQLFGIGIVETSEDFGTQGELPENQELLDWLAVDFMENGWSMKALCRTIVTSATYRQSSDATPGLLAQDPYNRLLARGPRFRLSAEVVRDQALCVAGLLSERMHGPSVMPYQPPGVWQVVYNGADWATSPGEDRYRRGLYTFWRRTSPYPSMELFDAPSREVCAVRRIRTNTPLQALVTLNDPVYVEAAQALARRITSGTGATTEARIEFAFQTVLGRAPEAAESQRLGALYQGEKSHYDLHREDAIAMASDPLDPVPEGADPAELAAWTVVSNVLLNLDEVLTKT